MGGNTYSTVLKEEIRPPLEALHRYIAALAGNPRDRATRNELSHASGWAERNIQKLMDNHDISVPADDRAQLRDMKGDAASLRAMLEALAEIDANQISDVKEYELKTFAKDCRDKLETLLTMVDKRVDGITGKLANFFHGLVDQVLTLLPMLGISYVNRKAIGYSK